MSSVNIKEVKSLAVRRAYRAGIAVLNTHYGVGADDRSRMMGSVFSDDNTRVFVALDAWGVLLGGVAFMEYLDRVQICALASFEAGVGSKLIRIPENLATRLKLPVTLQSLKASEGFYFRRGYEQIADGVLRLSKTNVREASTPRVRTPQIEFVLTLQTP